MALSRFVWVILAPAGDIFVVPQSGILTLGQYNKKMNPIGMTSE